MNLTKSMEKDKLTTTMNEQWEKERTEAISEMFDGVDECGIYPTAKFFNRIDNYVYQNFVSKERVSQLAEEMKKEAWVGGWWTQDSSRIFKRIDDFTQELLK